MRVRVLETPELGNRSYVVDDGTTSVVIDPQRDLDRLDPLLEHDVAYVLETHLHNDYVTGGLELARRTGAVYGVNALDEVRFDRLPLEDDQTLSAGALQVTAMATPGHTRTHLSYLVRQGDEQAVFSGGSLLYGTVGRTDLVSPDATRELTQAQWHSARRLGGLSPATALFPTHGFGSFCSAGAGAASEVSTIGQETTGNPALTSASEAWFVEELIASLGPHPSYYVHMAPLNAAGPGPVVASPAPLAPASLAGLLGEGGVVDLRPAEEFAAAHLAGSLSVPLGQQFATYVGWLTPWSGPLVVVGPDRDALDEAHRQLGRIGLDGHCAAWGPLDDLAPPVVERRSYPRVGFDAFAPEPGDTVLDVRREDEWREGHVRGAVHVPVHELAERSADLPRTRTWTYCAGGFRAGTAASILDARGFEVVHVDDSFDHAVELGLSSG